MTPKPQPIPRFASPASPLAAELCATVPVTAGKQVATAATVLTSCGLTGSLSAKPERFSSSSLPPSFAQRRRTTAFLSRRTASRGAPALRGHGPLNAHGAAGSR